MKIRTRLSLQFLGLFTILLSIVLVAIYFVVANHWQKNFFKQLEDRAYIVGHNYLAEDNFTYAEFQEVLRKFPRTLPKEQIRIYTLDFNPIFIEEHDLKWDKNILQAVVDDNKVWFKQGDNYVFGVLYKDNSGNYIIMAKAVDQTGLDALMQLRSIMLISLLIALLITFMLSRLFAESFLQPIRKIIQHVQSRNVDTLAEPISTTEMSKDEIRTLSEAINTLFERLHESFEGQKAFVAHASHELKTPIAAILGTAEITLTKEREPEVYQEALQAIIQDTIYTDQIINNLLTLAKLDQVNGDLSPIYFETFWWQTIDNLMLHHRELKLNFVVKTTEELHKLHVKGNQQLLSLALSNIVLNADKFSYNQTVDLILDSTSTAIIIQIKDYGIGIKAEDLEKLTLPFYRSSNAFAIPGTGLGLSLAFKIINIHHGSLTIESQFGQSTTVTIQLPKS
ncbi:sensor histidine kinase [Myroides fluvii]|uniref:sensor histidine kinase n=1 Tax=Myroides fluvii TaxID=2572594 RepID=UPI00131CF982|nr:HAMP domain-containing sensor histidine kinase [Myroides fluvii]